MSSAAAAPATNASAAIITEVVIQGVRRFGDVRRFTFGPGYNVVYGLGASGKTTLHDVLLSLLFATPAEGEAQSFASLLPQGKVACRAGMTLSLGGELWRVLKDYQQGTITLSKFNAAEKRFDLALSEPDAVQRWLVETARVPAGPGMSPVVAFVQKEFPSLADGVATFITRRDEMADTGFEERIRALPLTEKKALLAKLLAEYRRHADIRTTEYLQDGLRTKLFEVENANNKRKEIQKKIDEVELEFKDWIHVPKLPDGIDERIEAYKRMEKQREADLANLVPQQEAARAALEATIPIGYDEKTMRMLGNDPKDLVLLPIKKDRVLDAGLGILFVAVVCLFLGSAAMKVGGLLGVLGIAVVVWRGVWVFYRSLESFKLIRRDVDRIEEQLRLLERKWDIETSVVRNLMKAYDVDDPREMKDIEKKRDEGVAKVAELKKELDAVALPGGKKDLDKEHARVSQQIADLDKRLQELSEDLTGDPKELEPQIERLDREVARAEGRRPTSRAKLFQLDEAANENSQPGDESNAVTRLLEKWCAAREADLGKVLRGIQETFSRNVKALSGGRFSEGTFDAEGNVTLREDVRGNVPWEMLDATARDAAYLALRVTLFQLDARGSGRALVILDDPFEFEEPRLQAISRALKALAPGAQVIHLTSRPAHRKLADTAIDI